MRGFLRLAWLQNRKPFAYFLVAQALLAYFLAAPIAPMKNGLLQMVQGNTFLQKMLGAVMGLELNGEMTIKLLAGGSWGHPLLLLSALSFVGLCAARFPAQEIELAQIDLLISTPTSRSKILTAHLVVAWLLALSLQGVSLMAFFLGCRSLGDDSPGFTELLPLAILLFCISVWMHSATTLLSCRSSSRGAVLGPLSLFSLWSLILGYLGPFFGPAKTIAPLGLLYYYRPGSALQFGIGWGQLVLPLLLTLIFYGLAFWSLKNRDLT